MHRHMHLGVGWIAPVIAVAQIASHIVIQSCLGDNGDAVIYVSRGLICAAADKRSKQQSREPKAGRRCITPVGPHRTRPRLK